MLGVELRRIGRGRISAGADQILERISKTLKAMRAIVFKVDEWTNGLRGFNLAQTVLIVTSPLQDSLETFPGAALNRVGISISLLSRNGR